MRPRRFALGRRPKILADHTRQYLVIALLPVIAAGAVGQAYAIGIGGPLALLGYVACLCAACFGLRSICNHIERIDPGVEAISDSGVDTAMECGRGDGAEKILHEKDGPTLAACEATVAKVRKAATQTFDGGIQPTLDLDGMNALRNKDRVGGIWLVMEASDAALDAVEAACRDHLGPTDADPDRLRRWFEIIAALRMPECRALPKAELRRAYVADRHGVSKEQVRQIDQGRYAPLNKLLDMIDPVAL